MKNETPNANRQDLREALTTAIMFRVQYEIEEVIATLPPEEPEKVREGIRHEILPHTRFALGSLSLTQLQNENALTRPIGDAVRAAQYFVGRITAQRGRS